MKTARKTHSERAIDLAIAEFGGHPRTALISLFFAIGNRLGETFDRETAGELGYMVADDLATGRRR